MALADVCRLDLSTKNFSSNSFNSDFDLNSCRLDTSGTQLNFELPYNVDVR